MTVLVFSECPLGLDTTFHCEHGDNLCANIATIAGSQQITSFLCPVQSSPDDLPSECTSRLVNKYDGNGLDTIPFGRTAWPMVANVRFISCSVNGMCSLLLGSR